ncbi:MAG: hypothetical protein NTY01_04105 [Verrucomicrobia bacterium]|nr:hypothetical protein [Verrucomicrobiota bacterium]
MKEAVAEARRIYDEAGRMKYALQDSRNAGNNVDIKTEMDVDHAWRSWKEVVEWGTFAERYQKAEDLARLEEAWKNATGETLFKEAHDDRLLQMFTSHLERLRVERHGPTLAILKEVEARFIENAGPIRAMVIETLSDRKLHTKAIGGGGIRTWLLVSAVPSDRFSSATFFKRSYPPGYTGYMDFWLNSAPLKMARQMGHDVFAHVLVYAAASSSEPLSIGLGLVPLDPSRRESNPLTIIPEESLTPEEKAAMGR